MQQLIVVTLFVIVLDSCNIQSDDADAFNYTSQRDNLLKINTSASNGEFLTDSQIASNILVELRCVHNELSPSKNELILTASSDSRNFNALIYKIGDSDPVVYKEPNPWDDFINSSPDDEYGRYREAYGAAYSVGWKPPASEREIKLDFFQLVRKNQPMPQNITLRFVFMAPETGFGEETAQVYSQYPSKDLKIRLAGSNFGKVISDCGIN